MGIAEHVVFGGTMNESSPFSLALVCEVVVVVVLVLRVATSLLLSPSNLSSSPRNTFFSIPLSPPLSSAAMGGGLGLVAEAEFLERKLRQTSTKREGVGKPCL